MNGTSGTYIQLKIVCEPDVDNSTYYKEVIRQLYRKDLIRVKLNTI